MASFSESPVFAVTRAGMTLPTPGAFLPVAGKGRAACATSASSGLSAVKGTAMPQLSQAHAEKPIFGQALTRKPYTDQIRVTALGGGAKGPHPVREPGPV